MAYFSPFPETEILSWNLIGEDTIESQNGAFKIVRGTTIVNTEGGLINRTKNKTLLHIGNRSYPFNTESDAANAAQAVWDYLKIE